MVIVNVQEGTRRLALLLGVVGAILGGYASFVKLGPVIRQGELHSQFEQLAASSVVEQQRKIAQQDWTPANLDTLAKRYGGVVTPAQPGTQSDSAPISVPKGLTLIDGSDVTGASATAIHTPSEVNMDGIRTINWTHDFGVASIETEDGKTLYPIPAPDRWLYFLAAFFPVLGFFVPWAAIRAIAWVGYGFSQPSN